MNAKREGAIAIMVALIVLFSAMWNPLVSVSIAFIALLGIGLHTFIQKTTK